MFTVFDFSTVPCRTYEFATLVEAAQFLVEMGLPEGMTAITLPAKAKGE